MSMNEENRICETTDCNNKALKGKYCRQCTQLKKDKRAKIKNYALGIVGGVMIPLAGKAIKKAPTAINAVVKIMKRTV